MKSTHFSFSQKERSQSKQEALSSASLSRFQPGFALVLSLVVTLLLVTLVIGLLLFVRSQQKIAQPILESLRAEANAKLAASLSLGQVQKMLGPDQRATASALSTAIAQDSATFLGQNPSSGVSTMENERHAWVGVWSTAFEFDGIPYPVIGTNDDDNVGPFGNNLMTGLLDRRYSRFGPTQALSTNASFLDWMIEYAEGSPNNRLSRPNLLEGFLVSGENPNPATSSTLAAATLANYLYRDPLNPANLIEMDAQAPLVDQSTQAGMNGSYAYLAIDQSMKAAVRQNPWSSAGSLNSQQALAAEILSHAPSLSALPSLPNQIDENLAALSGQLPTSIQDMVSLGGGLDDWLEVENALAFTPNLGIFSNSRLGGLKQDFSAFLASSDQALSSDGPFAGTAVARRNPIGNDLSKSRHLSINPTTRNISALPSNTRGVRDLEEFPADTASTNLTNPIFPGDGFDELGPTYDAFRQYMRLGEELIRSGSQASLPNDRLFVGTRVGRVSYSAASVPFNDMETGYQSVLAKHRGVEVSNNVNETHGSKAQRLHPIVVEAGFWWNFTLEEIEESEDAGGGSPPADGTPTISKRIVLHIYPKVVLWNPYNVDIPAQSYLMNMPGSVFGESPNNGDPYDSRVGFQFATPPEGGPNTFGVNIWDIIFDSQIKVYEDFFFHLEPTQLAPGETLVFTANPSSDSVDEEEGDLLLTQPDSTATSAPYKTENVFLNTLSAKKLPDASSFHFPAKDPINPEFNDLEIDNVNSQSPFFRRSENFYLHALEPSFGTTPTSVDDITGIGAAGFAAQNMPLIQRIYADLPGSYWSGKNLDYVAKAWRTPANAYAGNSLGPFSELGDTAPPRLWRRGARLHMMDESTEYDGFRNVGILTDMPEKMLRRPLFTTHNLRHHLNSRSAASPFIDPQGSDVRLELFMLHSGGMYYLPWGDPPFFNDPSGRTDVEIDPVTGNAAASPYLFSGLAGTRSDGSAHRYVLFDVPVEDFEPLSLMHFRDADFSPFSWHSTYPLGSGMAAAQADYDSTFLEIYAREDTEYQWSEPFIPTFERNLVRMWDIVAYDQWTQEGEQVLYDLGYKLNYYLLDDYFLSTLPYNEQNEFSWDWQSTLLNSRVQAFPSSTAEQTLIEGNGFQTAATMLYNEGAFNVNSTDIQAWIAFLASTRNKIRNTTTGAQVGSRTSNESVYARFIEPHDTSNSINSSVDNQGAHSGVFLLTDTQIQTLAEKIVEVNLERGPALTVAEFCSRPLVAETLVTGNATPLSRRSRLEEAIFRSGLNANLISGNTGSQSATIDKTQTPNSNQNTIGDGFRDTSSTLPEDNFLMEETLVENTVTWGMPGFFTQQDLLEPLLPSITTRGDTFVIRCLGTSQDSGQGARRILEITLQRSPEYLHHQDQTATAASANFGNLPQDALLLEDRETSTLTLNDQLMQTNLGFGRRFRMVSQRWLSENDL